MSLDPRVDTLMEKVKKLEATVEALSAIIYHREPSSQNVTKENVLEGFSLELLKLVEADELNGEVRVRTTRWLADKSKWATINKLLRDKGLTWHRDGKNSYWGNR